MDSIDNPHSRAELLRFVLSSDANPQRDSLRQLWQLVSDKQELAAIHCINRMEAEYQIIRDVYQCIESPNAMSDAMLLALKLIRLFLRTRRVGLKVCAYPPCTHKYFYRVNNRDTYCSERCKASAKQDRLFGDKVYKRPEEARKKMSKAALARWARV